MANQNIRMDNDRATGLALATGSAASMPFGQAVGAHAFDTLTPVGVVTIRQLVTPVMVAASESRTSRGPTTSSGVPIPVVASH